MRSSIDFLLSLAGLSRDIGEGCASTESFIPNDAEIQDLIDQMMVPDSNEGVAFPPHPLPL